MILKSPDPTSRVVEDYEFSFNGGQVLPITIDRELGDTVSFDQAPLAIVIKLVAKPSKVDPDRTLPPEEITIFHTHLIAIQKRPREVTDLTVEQREQWKAYMKTFAQSSPSSRVN